MGLLVLTDRRLLFVKDGWTSQTTESFGFDQVNSVQWSSGMLLGSIIIYSAGNQATVGHGDKSDGRAMVDAVNDILTRPAVPAPPQHAPTPPPPPVQQAPPLTPFDALKLLRDQKVISPEEFGQPANRL